MIVATELANCVLQFLKISPQSIDAIGSHGQTIYHSAHSKQNSTLQLGSPSIIAELTGITTIANFRVRDMAAGGRGAPLVGIVDYILFHKKGECVAVNNLGSISNVTVVGEDIDQLHAFDTGPANMPIDFFAQQYLADGIDRGGLMAKEGVVIPDLLKAFMSHSFFDLLPPKAAGYDEFGHQLLKKISAGYIHCQPQDLLRTAVEFSAQTLSEAYRKFIFPRFPNLKRAIFFRWGNLQPHFDGQD